jgi:hypothetical protein
MIRIVAFSSESKLSRKPEFTAQKTVRSWISVHDGGTEARRRNKKRVVKPAIQGDRVAIIITWEENLSFGANCWNTRDLAGRIEQQSPRTSFSTDIGYLASTCAQEIACGTNDGEGCIDEAGVQVEKRIHSSAG